MNNEAKYELQIFASNQFGQIRTLMLEDVPWFAAVDVCNALEIGNSRQAVTRLDDDEKMTVTSNDSHTGQRGGAQMLTFVNESGLYALVLSSRKPEAKQFKRWITHDVIPTIRKHGIYMTGSTLEQVSKNPELIVALARQLVEEQQEKAELSKKLEVARPKVEYFDQFINADDCTNIRNTAKELGIPERDLIHFLLEKHYLYRDQAKQLMPYAQYTKCGYFILRDYYRANGAQYQYTLFTAKGKNHFRQLLERRKRGEQL